MVNDGGPGPFYLSASAFLPGASQLIESLLHPLGTFGSYSLCIKVFKQDVVRHGDSHLVFVVVCVIFVLFA